MTDITNTTAMHGARNSYFIPALQPVYTSLSAAAETLLRVVAGIALMVHGWPKIQNPMGASGMVEGIGFVPGWFWSPALSITEFCAGLLLVLGLLTRPAAVAASIILLITVWFHWVQLEQGYRGAELSIIWSAVTLLFAVRGGGLFSLDRAIGRQI